MNCIDLEKCRIKQYVFHFCKKGLTFREIYDQANITRKAQMMYSMQGLKKMIRNYLDLKRVQT